MIPLPVWMRRALFATAGMNILVALAFLPGADRARAVAGFPEGGHPLFLGMIALFVLLFGLGYLWAALTGHADHLFIALATVGKLTFFVMLVGFWAAGAVPFRAPALGTADLVFGILFLTWLLNARTGTRHAARRVMSADTPASRSRA